MVFSSREEMLAALGTSLHDSRLAMNISQQTAADRSGISLKAVRNIESGANASTYSLLSLCRTLGKTDWILSLAPPEINAAMFERPDPLQKRLRASGKRKGTSVRHGRADS